MSRQRRQRAESEPPIRLFSFPVFFGICLGAFLSLLLVPFLGYLLFLASLMGLSYCSVHLFNQWRRRNFVEKAERRAEEEERERRALAARAAAQQQAAAANPRRRRRRRGSSFGPTSRPEAGDAP